MPSLLKVVLNNEVPVYAPGDVVEGKVTLHTDKDVALKGIIVRCRGKAQNRWYDPHIRKERECNEEYIDDHILVFPQDGIRPKKAVTVPAGNSEYPFQFHLPTKIPNSFEGAHGFVRYEIFVNADQKEKDDLKTKKVFTVFGVHDLNKDKSVKLAEQTITSTHTVGLLRKKPVELQACWDKGGYVPGENVQVELNVNNESSNQVSKIKLALNQVCQFYGDVPTYGKLANTAPPNRAMKEHKAVATQSKDNVQMKKSSSGTWQGKLQIPSLPPSDLPHCDIINLEYKVIVSVKCGSKNLEFNFPVRIGTVPASTEGAKTIDYKASFKGSVFGSVSTGNEIGEKWNYGGDDSVFTPLYKVFTFDDYLNGSQQQTSKI